MIYEHKFLLSLALTLMVETGVLFLLARLWLKEDFKQASNAKLVFGGVFGSFATLPYLWFVLPVWLKTYMVLIIGGEILVVFLELVFYCFLFNITWRKALIVSVCCNAVSILAGLLVMG